MENLKLKEFKENIKGKKVAIIGIGTSNIPAIKYLSQLGARVVAKDKNENALLNHEELKVFENVEFELGEKYLENLDQFDYILRAPGVKPFLPEIEEAEKSGVILTSEIELLFALAPCKIIGVTGSAGKTTTVTLIHEILKRAGYKVWLGGNIGNSLFDQLDEMREDDLIVLELSSFQLMTMKQSPQVALITSIYEDHLDYHRSFEEYIEAKTNIFMHQKQDDIFVVNLDDKFCEKFLKEMEENHIQSKILAFSTKKTCKNGAYYKDNKIYISIEGNQIEVIDVSKIHLIGEKNYANICSAICCILEFVNVDIIAKTLVEFKGVEHRLEYVDTKNGVKYYNDSISTTPGKAMAAFTSFDQKIILIAGGSDKNLDYTPVGSNILHCAKILILLGNTSKKIKEAVIHCKEYRENELKIYEVSSMKEAVNLAKEVAIRGDIVVMSPASASFDLYKNYKERGKDFKNLVNTL
ncbi:MAG: UDP-N-acetylmuramoyl-L-alanine--D-glutamate ligase [Clostridia bacterium]|nr:UDP-N-acetylmuramoyl-L-alanine--D-glutamate ligase [Clostridia bacterium]